MSIPHRIRPAAPDDEPFLKELFRDVRLAEFLPLNLPEASLTQLLDLQFKAQKSSYAQQFPHLQSSIILVGPYRVGRLLVNEDASAIRLVDIALLAPFRSQGIGNDVITSLCRRAADSGLALRLSVRAGNPAIRLYKRLGFIPRDNSSFDIEMDWGGSLSPAPPPADAVIDQSPATPGANSAYLRTLQGTAITLQRSSSERVTLTLLSVRSLPQDPDPQVVLGDSFCATFEGEANALLPQNVYELTFADGFALPMLLVPVAVAGTGATYEAIFNRMSRAPAPAAPAGPAAAPPVE